MAVVVERDLFLHAGKSYDLLRKAIQTFEEYLEKNRPPKSKEYQRARNLLKQGQGYLDETLKKSKQLLGPLSTFPPEEIQRHRAELLAENKIIVLGLNLGDLHQELVEDEFLRTMLSPEEIDIYLKEQFISQCLGQRKLANIKVRMIIDKLKALANRGQELQAAAQEHFQGT